jgi:hypothetical protein
VHIFNYGGELHPNTAVTINALHAKHGTTGVGFLISCGDDWIRDGTTVNTVRKPVMNLIPLQLNRVHAFSNQSDRKFCGCN